MHTLHRGEIDYYKKVDRRNGRSQEYSLDGTTSSTVLLETRTDKFMQRADGVEQPSASQKTKNNRKFKTEDFKVKMGSSVTQEISESLRMITTNRHDVRDLASHADTRRLASILLQKGDDLTKLNIPDTKELETKLESKQFFFKQGGFARKPFVNKTTLSKKRKAQELDVPSSIMLLGDEETKKMGPEKQTWAYNQNIHINDDSSDKTKQQISGVVFCDCKCKKCEMHTTSNPSNSSNMVLNKPHYCYYKGKESKIEYVIKDKRWSTNSVDHVQVIEPIIESLQIVENSNHVKQRISLQNILELLDASSIVPVSISLFCLKKAIQTKKEQQILCYTKAQEDEDPIISLEKIMTQAKDKSTNKTAIEQIQERYAIINGQVNQRICCNMSHMKDTQNTSSYSDKKHVRHICAVVESKCTTDVRIIIRTCLIFQDQTLKTVCIPEELFNAHVKDTNDYHNNLKIDETTEYGTLYTSLISQVLGLGKHETNGEPGDKNLDKLIRIVLEFNEGNNIEMKGVKSMDFNAPSFFSLDNLEKTDRPIGILWKLVKTAEIWKYCRSFLMLAPDL